MFEHVGLRNLPVYFGTVRRLLRERGLFLNHGITSTDVDNRDGRARRRRRSSTTTCSRNGELPHLHLAMRDMSGAGFEVARRRVPAPALREDARALVGPRSRRSSPRPRTKSIRKRCAYGASTWWAAPTALRQGWMNIYQMLGSKQSAAGADELPLTREYMYPERGEQRIA